MEFTKIEDLFGEERDEVAARGWCSRVRQQKENVFVILRDSTGKIQVTFKKDDLDEETFEEASELTVESAVKLTGSVREDERAPGDYELRADSLEVVHLADRFPIVDDKSTEFLLDVRHLWLRSDKITNAMKVKGELLRAGRGWFRDNDFFEVTPSIITPSAAEGSTTLFELDYFDETAYLSQSAQLYLEGLIFPLEKVWALTPSFRAEKSRTSRHLSEYWHLEAEMAWMDEEQNREVQEQLLSHMVQQVAGNCEDQLRELDRDPAVLKKVEPPFERISYEEALDILQEEGMDLEWGDDLRTKEERKLVEGHDKPIFVTDFPLEAKAFYMKRNPDEETAACADVIAPEGFGEIIGGSERSEDIEYMEERLKEEGTDIDSYEWYFDLRKYGSVPHSGFGVGIERVVRWLCDLDHIRDATPYPRTINRYYP